MPGYAMCADCGCPVQRPGWDDLCDSCREHANWPDEETTVAPDLDPRLLDPAQDPPRPTLGTGAFGRATMLAWIARTDAARTRLQEAVEVLADYVLGEKEAHEMSRDLALLLASEWRRRVKTRCPGTEDTAEDYLEAMVADGLRVRERS